MRRRAAGRRGRRAAAPMPSGRTSSRGSQRTQPGRRHDPLVGVERAQHLVRVQPRVELHGADRDAPGSRGRRRSATRPDVDRVAGLGAVPVGGAVVGPVRRPPAERVAVAARRGRLRRRAARPTGRGRPAARRRVTTASVVAKPAGTSSRSPCQPHAGPLSSAAKHCSCAPPSGASSTVVAVGADEQRRAAPTPAGAAAAATSAGACCRCAPAGRTRDRPKPMARTPVDARRVEAPAGGERR